VPDKTTPFDERTITDSNTGESLAVRDVINEVTDTAQLDILREIQSEPVTPADLEAREVVSRKTAHNHITVLTARGFLRKRDGRYECSAAGLILLRELEVDTEDIELEALATVSRSAYKSQVLRVLSVESVGQADLLGDDSESMSERRFEQIRHDFEDRGWVARDYEHGRYRLTAQGERLLTFYNELTRIVEQLLDKASFLQRLEAVGANFPAERLASARMVEASGSDRHAVVAASQELAKGDFEQLRGVVPINSQPTNDAYRPHIRGETDVEVIIDSAVHRTLLQPQNIQYLLDWITAENTKLLIHPASLSFGLGIFDDQKVIIAANDDPNDHEVAIISSDDAIVDWALDTYEAYRGEAQYPVEHFKQVLRDFAG